MKHRPLPFHPFLFGLAPILFAYAHNVRQIPVHPGEMVLPVIVTFGLGLVLWTLLALMVRDWAKAAVIVSLFLILFFLYGHVQAALGSSEARQSFLIPVFAVLIAASSILILRARGNLSGLTLVLNFIGAVLVVMNLAAALPGLVRTGRGREAVSVTATGPVAGEPDIYYIILDEYTRSDYLKSVYHTDNSAFLLGLERDGFMVAGHGRPNYGVTYFSLASSLNFTYLDSLARAEGPNSLNDAPLISMIEHNRLADFLRRRGYHIVTFASGYTGTELADAELRLGPFWQPSEFQNMLFGTTMLAGVLELASSRFDSEMHARLIRYTLATIPRAGKGRHPAFVFAHVVCPHLPFVFDARGARPKFVHYDAINPNADVATVNGKELRGGKEVREWYEANYGPQVQYLDVLVREMVDRILADSAHPAVIILQGDHGPHFEPEHFTILNAIRVPPAVVRHPEAAALYDSITPVNTFRVLLSRLFDTTMSLLPDRSYTSPSDRPYDFRLVEQPKEAESVRAAAGR
jgi:hypothetical protein